MEGRGRGLIWRSLLFCVCLKKLRKPVKNAVHDSRSPGRHWTGNHTNVHSTSTFDRIRTDVGLRPFPNTSSCCDAELSTRKTSLRFKYFFSDKSFNVQMSTSERQRSHCIHSEVFSGACPLESHSQHVDASLSVGAPPSDYAHLLALCRRWFIMTVKRHPCVCAIDNIYMLSWVHFSSVCYSLIDLCARFQRTSTTKVLRMQCSFHCI